MRSAASLVILAFAGTSLGQASAPRTVQPYLTGDVGFGKLSNFDADKDTSKGAGDWGKGVSMPLFLTASGGILLGTHHIGLGGFYLHHISGASLKGAYKTARGQPISSAEHRLGVSILGAQLVALPPLGSKVNLRVELGLGHADVENEIKVKMMPDAQEKTRVLQDAMAVVVGTGLDVMVEPHLGVGAKVVHVSGVASGGKARTEIWVDQSKESVEFQTEGMGDFDFSSFHASFGIRMLF